LKRQVKSVLGPAVRAAWPVVETIGALEARAIRDVSEVRWADEWTEEFDRALDALPALPDCSHDLYRELLKPTRARKRHALVLENGKPSALVSLRQAGRHWEPVAYQCIPGAIAPAADPAALARALHALGMEVRVPAGLGADVAALEPSDCWAYDCHKIDVAGDYEGYWRERKRLKRIRRSLRDTKTLRRRIDGAGDLEWIVEQWVEQWRDDPGQEALAGEDRVRVWSALAKRNDTPLKLHTLMLADGERRASAFVVLCKGDVVSTQCSVRDRAYPDSGTATHVFAVEWAKAQGFRTLDLGSGVYKRDWGPVGGQRFGAVFRPRVMSALSWACSY
jgi:CelD/BcsL family acetyltransferase involved in cellulose biosynthesis